LAVAGAGEIAAHVAQYARSGDVLLVMSNGGFDGVHDKILQALTG
jgi:UDP-N-acetylmuramate: L-alanyl-gamma-D-glutamyl-meso-diaminopimelate ligase